MRKMLMWLLVFALGAGLLTGCSPKDVPAATQPSDTQTEQTTSNLTETQEPLQQENLLGHEDTYWVATQWQGADGGGAESAEPQTLPTENWNLDLTVWVDGTARFRDIHEGILLMDESCLNLTWERTPEGEFLFYSMLYPEPVLRGVCWEDTLFLDYWGTKLTMKREEMPTTIGQLHTPAELAGTWLLVSGETEGWQWEAMPGELSSIVFQVTAYDGPLVLSADVEERDYYGNLQYSGCGQWVEILQEPLYEGCVNDAWSIRIGEAAPLDENGWPTQMELYATLTGDNTLLLQRCYTLDGYPAVSYQTYQRFPDLVGWMSHDSMNLDYSNWVITGYEDFSGRELPLPDEMEDFSIVLCPGGACYVYYGDGSAQAGTWLLENGGVLLLRGDENLDEPFWFGGVISGYWVETGEASLETYQMTLYCNGGILKLSMTSYG